MSTSLSPTVPAESPAPAAPAPGDGQPPRPVRILPSFFGALTTFSAATAIIPLTDSANFLLPLGGVIAVIFFTGIAARMLQWPARLVEVTQLAAMVFALVGLYLDHAIAAIVPTAQTWQQAWGLLQDAAAHIRTAIPPAPVTPALTFFLGLALAIIALTVDLLIAGSRVPAMAALPLLAIYTVASAINTAPLPWYAAVLPAICYFALLAVDHPQLLPVAAGGMTRAAAWSVTAIALAIAGGLVAGSLATGVGTEGRIARTPSPNDAGVSINPWALLRGDIQGQQQADLFTVTGLPRPEYLRTFTLEKWTADTGFGLGPVVANFPLSDGPLPGLLPQDRTATAQITTLAYHDRYLPLYLSAQTVTGLERGWNWDTNLDTAFVQQPVRPQPYSVAVSISPPEANQLRGSSVRGTSMLTDTAGVPAQVHQLAADLTAGLSSPFDKADAILDYFTNPANGFIYSLTTPLGNSGSALVDFLTHKQGYCEQYAATMAIMLRSVGVPARVGIGFTQGEVQADGSYLISSTNAHAWVEVNFHRQGWVLFDPTPAVGDQGGLQGFTDRRDTSVSPSPISTPTAPTTSAAPVSPTAATTVPATTPVAEPQVGHSAPAAAYGLPLFMALAGLVLLGMMIAAPAWWRRRLRERRLGAAAAGGDTAALRAWEEIVATAIDHRLPLADPAQSLRSWARQLAAAADLSDSARTSLSAVAVAVEKIWYDVPRQDRSLPALRQEAETVVTDITQRHDATWWQRLFPASLSPRRRLRARWGNSRTRLDDA